MAPTEYAMRMRRAAKRGNAAASTELGHWHLGGDEGRDCRKASRHVIKRIVNPRFLS